MIASTLSFSTSSPPRPLSVNLSRNLLYLRADAGMIASAYSYEPKSDALPTTTAEPDGLPPPPASWDLAPTGGLASLVTVTSARPNAIRMSGRDGFRVVLTLRPVQNTAVALLLPIEGGRVGPSFRLKIGDGSTSQGYGCQARTNADNAPFTLQIGSDAAPASESWRQLEGPTNLILDYGCDQAVTSGDSVSFSFGLYVRDDTMRGRRSTWSANALPAKASSAALD